MSGITLLNIPVLFQLFQQFLSKRTIKFTYHITLLSNFMTLNLILLFLFTKLKY